MLLSQKITYLLSRSKCMQALRCNVSLKFPRKSTDFPGNLVYFKVACLKCNFYFHLETGTFSRFIPRNDNFGGGDEQRKDSLQI